MIPNAIFLHVRDDHPHTGHHDGAHHVDDHSHPGKIGLQVAATTSFHVTIPANDAFHASIDQRRMTDARFLWDT